MSVGSPCLLPMCSVCEQFRKVWNRVQLLDISVRVPLFFSFVFSFLEPCIIPRTVSNNEWWRTFPSSYCRVIMPVLNTTNVLVIVYIQDTEVLAWLQLSFVLTSQIRWSYLINKLRNMNEIVADVLHTPYNDHEIHARFHWSPGVKRYSGWEQGICVTITKEPHKYDFIVTPYTR